MAIDVYHKTLEVGHRGCNAGLEKTEKYVC